MTPAVWPPAITETAPASLPKLLPTMVISSPEQKCASPEPALVTLLMEGVACWAKPTAAKIDANARNCRILDRILETEQAGNVSGFLHGDGESVGAVAKRQHDGHVVARRYSRGNRGIKLILRCGPRGNT